MDGWNVPGHGWTWLKAKLLWEHSGVGRVKRVERGRVIALGPGPLF
jgi:hypothetical protein